MAIMFRPAQSRQKREAERTYYRILALPYALLSVVLLSGCVSDRTQETFRDVRADLEERTEFTIRWHQTSGIDEDVRGRVKDLLADELELDDAVRVALLNNRRLQSMYETLGVSQAQLVEAGLLSNPSFEALYKDVDGNGHIWELTVAQEVMDALMMPLRKRVARYELAATEAKVKARVMDIIREVRTAYYRFLAGKKTVSLLEDVVKANAAGYDLARQLRDAGNIPKLEVFQRRALRERVRLSLSAAELELAERRERLNRLMGLWGVYTEWEVNGELPDIPDRELDLDDMQRRVVSSSLRLKAADMRMRRAAQQAGIVKIT